MRCISLWQPWALLVVIGAKTYETRSWRTNATGPLLIHAAKRQDPESMGLARTEPFQRAFAAVGVDPGNLPFGAIVGQVELVACIESLGGLYESVLRDGTRVTDLERGFGDFTAGRFAWRLRNAVRFSVPIPWRASQGIFSVPLR